jgi:hypothetical protein
MTAVDDLVLMAAGLLSKWGFDDGDMPDAVDDRLFSQGHEVPSDVWRRTLARLVREHLLPALDQHVEAVEIDTIHNPIRASTIDGVNVHAAGALTLTPERVAVPMAEVLRVLIEELGESA